MENSEKYAFSAHAEVAIENRGIKKKWIFETIANPQVTEKDADDPEICHFLMKILENDGRVLRVVLNYTSDPQKVVTAFFDRGMRNKL